MQLDPVAETIRYGEAAAFARHLIASEVDLAPVLEQLR
jgi:hypothetical protein